MILREKYKKPRISFGLAKVEETISLGQTIRIWQNEIYNNDTFELLYLGGRAIYGFELTPVSIGTLEIEVKVVTKDGLISLPSNKIILNVV